MTTIVTFLLDRTGSMGGIKAATIEGFNAYIDGIRKSPDTTFSLIQFDSISIDTVCKNVNAVDAPELTNENFIPRASTPLIDACVKTIKAVERSVSEKPGSKVVICFQTDGDENCSREHTWAELNDLIKEKTALGWQFNFMGAGIDAYKQAARMGLGVMNTMSYDASNIAATRSAYGSRGAATATFASGATQTMDIGAAEKMMAGDKFDPDAIKAKAAEVKKAIVDEVDL